MGVGVGYSFSINARNTVTPWTCCWFKIIKLTKQLMSVDLFFYFEKNFYTFIYQHM